MRYLRPYPILNPYCRRSRGWGCAWWTCLAGWSRRPSPSASAAVGPRASTRASGSCPGRAVARCSSGGGEWRHEVMRRALEAGAGDIGCLYRVDLVPDGRAALELVVHHRLLLGVLQGRDPNAGAKARGQPGPARWCIDTWQARKKVAREPRRLERRRQRRTRAEGRVRGEEDKTKRRQTHWPARPSSMTSMPPLMAARAGA